MLYLFKIVYVIPVIKMPGANIRVVLSIFTMLARKY